MAKDSTATITFKGEDQISPAIKGATASVAGLSKSFDAVDTEAKQAGDSIRENLVKQIEAARQRFSDFAKQGLKVEQGQALGELRRLQGELKKLDAPIAIKPKVEFDSLQLNAISQSFGAISGKLTELKGAAAAAFGEIAAAERKLSTVSNQSKELIKNFGDLAAANKFQTTTAELATASYEVLSAGFSDAADVTKILDASTKGAVGGFSDVTTVSKATISALNAYGAGADQAAAFVDKFVSVQQSGLITVDQYASQIARIAPTAAAAGLSLDELNGAIATATAAGVPVESTFAGLRTALGAILKPSSQAVELAQELGINFNAAGLKTLGLSGILKQLKTTGNDSADTLLKLFGSAEALAAIAPSINSIEKLEANIKASADSAGLAATNFEKAINPAKALANETTEALAVLGRDVVKVFNPVLGISRAVVQAFKALPQPLREVIAFVVGGGAAIAATGASLSGFLAVLKPTLAGLTTLITALGAVNITAGLAKINMALFSPVVVTAGASSATASIGVAGLGTALAGLATTAAAALVPLGLVVAAVKGAEFAKYANDIKAFNDELDNASAGNTQAGNNATRLADRLKSLANERKKGGVVTEDQIRKEKEYLKLADQEIATQKRLLDEAKKLKPANDEQRNSQAALISGYEISIKQLEGQKKALSAAVIATKQKTVSNKAAARSEKEVEEAIDRRIAKEKRAVEDAARLRGREFEKQSKAETDTFEKQSREEKRTFERSLSAEQKAFADAQKADKEQFEKGLLAEQKAFNDSEKAKDSQFQKERQNAERAFNDQQQALKAAFNEAQQQAAKDFDEKQNAEKLAAEGQFAKRRVEIERQLQLDAAATPGDKAKLEAEFKAADEKAAKEKAAFAQLKAEEEAFTLKQQQAKIAFDEAQKAAAAALEKQQQAAKIAFDDALKQKDQAYEAQKQAAKLAFEDQIKAKRDALEATQNAAKLAFEDRITQKKQAFEDAERAKKAAFDDAQNQKKQAFEDAERAKKAAFEDNLKALERQFKKEEREKDIAAAKQVAAIKSGSTSALGGTVSAALGITPRAKGGSFRAGQQLLVGERGAELVTFGAGGYVSNATDTKQILRSSNNSPSGVNMARVEALLGQLVGKMDRPNIAVQTSENPSDVVVKVQREIARAAAMGAGI